MWATWEHQNNPGRCDVLGCWGSFGAKIPEVEPNMRDRNSQYGACEKTPELAAILSEAGLDPAWGNYCPKATMVDYSAPDGTPYVLGNSVIEGVVGNGTVAASSCIACPVYASFHQQVPCPPPPRTCCPTTPTGSPSTGSWTRP